MLDLKVLLGVVGDFFLCFWTLCRETGLFFPHELCRYFYSRMHEDLLLFAEC